MNTQEKEYWTNPSVIGLAGDSDPIQFIEEKARELVLDAIQEGWRGPPFDSFELAERLNIQTVPREDIHDARMVPSGIQRLRIEFNPNRPRGRIRFSVAHEIAHALFPDCAEAIRSRGHFASSRDDDWQMELLCNVAAAEFLMPIGTGMALEHESVNIDNILRLQKQYDVSTEAISLRLIKITEEPRIMFTAARTSDRDQAITHRIDYNIASRSIKLDIPRGFKVLGKTILSQCTAVGFTAKGTERWSPTLPEIYLECVGIPPYPGYHFPRIIGIGHSRRGEQVAALRIKYLWGDALQPRGTGPHIIAHIVNDKTPNWGGLGFARQVKKRLPSVQDDFYRWAAERENLSLGNTHLSKVSDALSVMSLIAQHGYGPSRKPRIRYGMLRDCLNKLAEIALSTGASIHMPRIGSGQAGGYWGIIAEIIDEVLVRNGIEVTVYSLPNQEMEETQSLLNLHAGN